MVDDVDDEFNQASFVFNCLKLNSIQSIIIIILTALS